MKANLNSFESFKHYLDTIENINLNAKQYFKDIEYLHSPNKTKYEAAAFVNTRLLRRLSIAFWRICIIELGKLFVKSRNHHFNFFSLLQHIEKHKRDHEWLRKIPEKEVWKWKVEAGNSRIQEIIKKIKYQRDKYIAHTDWEETLKDEIHDSIISMSEIDEVLLLSDSILKKLNEYCLNSLRTNDEIEIRAGGILAAFAALYNLSIDEIEKLIKN